MSIIFTKHAFLPEGWQKDVRLEISNGWISKVEPNQTDHETDFRVDVTLPGVPNAHSHTFQRALVGHCEFNTSDNIDDFWTWRSQMYKLACKIDAAAMHIIARQMFVEMLESGYTSVAEFHYLHREGNNDKPTGKVRDALFAAANEIGIRFTYVPVLYERAGFTDETPNTRQRQFAMSIAEFIDDFQQACELAGSRQHVGIGAHSLRAVSKNSLDRIVESGNASGCPIHVHAAEQIAEVQQCFSTYGRTPVDWLSHEYALNSKWCLVHCTHTTEIELQTLANAGAVVCVCPSTEANLGDGLFNLQQWLAMHGKIAIGSDSQVCLDPFEELRWLEYGQRLYLQSRNVSAVGNPHTGTVLFSRILEGGGLASGNSVGKIETGKPADLITFDIDQPVFAGHDASTFLDALVFSAIKPSIHQVMVGGEWVVRDGKHKERELAAHEYIDLVQSLW